MIEFEWNELRADDRVVIHAYSNGYQQPTLGTVVTVTQQAGHNDVGVRPDGDDDAVVLWPTRLEVHAMNDVATSVCPWCSTAAITRANAASNAGTPRAGARGGGSSTSGTTKVTGAPAVALQPQKADIHR